MKHATVNSSTVSVPPPDRSAPQSPTLINVCGMPRSGTTMLGLMLASGDDAVSCGEACAWFRVARHRPGATVPDSYAPVKDVSERNFHSHLMAHHGVSFVVDSSKDLDWVIDHTRRAPENGLRVFNILIHKSPVDIALSWWKRGDYGRWCRYYLRYHAQLLYAGVDLWTVAYDDLVRAPAATLRHLCALTGLSYFEGKERFWAFNHELLGSNSRGVRDQVGKGRSEFKKPTTPADFAPLAEQVERASARNRLLQHLRRKLAERDAMEVDTSVPPSPHRYRPGVLPRLSYTTYRALKLPWGRFRWNVIEPHLAAFRTDE